jgi:RND family efflux transporter MFP subunit
VVVATYVENYEDVRAKQPVVRIVNDSSVEMVVGIPESLIAFAPDVKDIRVTFDAFPDREIPAEIKEIGSEASEITRTYPVTLIMEQPEDFRVLPGMAGRATGTPPLEAFGKTMQLPVSALFSPDETGTSFVWVIDEPAGTVSRRAVEVGTLTVAGVQVISGLEPGEWVATAGVHYLTEGQKVQILEGEGS